MILTVALATSIVSSSAAETPRSSLYERLGGMPAIRAVVDDFVNRILAGERVNRWFAHVASDPEEAAAYKSKLADFICQGNGSLSRLESGRHQARSSLDGDEKHERPLQ
jgi:hemoglobin